MATYSLDHLRRHSGLPGPRGNLSLLHLFAKNCDESQVRQCLSVIRPNTANSPDEFLGMCGVLGFALLNHTREPLLLEHLSHYARHSSWRLREAVAIAIQELPFPSLSERVRFTAKLECDDSLVHRAIIAGLCEPKNLDESGALKAVFGHLERATQRLDTARPLDEADKVLKKSLGYAWSVALVAGPEKGKPSFEKLLKSPNRHLRWLASENLGKARLKKMDTSWVASCLATLGAGS